MSTLNSLKLVVSKKHQSVTPIVMRRQKLSDKLTEQLALCEAKKTGDIYAPKKMKTYTNKQTGERMTVETVKRVREWFWHNSTGRLTAIIKYGAATLTLGKGGKNAFEVSDVAELIAAFNSVKAAVIAGELDDAIADASVRTRKAFGK